MSAATGDGDRWIVPPAEGRAIVVDAGAELAVVDVRGGQVGDLFVFCQDDPAEYLSAGHTRAVVGRLFPHVGEAFVTNRRRPVMTLVADTSPGIHDMLIPACDPERYRLLGVDGWHANCRENLEAAMAALGVDLPLVPQPVNVFMNSPVRDDGSIDLLPSPSRPGDRLVLRAEQPAVLALTSCAQDVVEISTGGLTELAVEVSR